jgi:hypothetical protein
MSSKNLMDIKDIHTRNVILSLITRIEVLESKIQDLSKQNRIEDERQIQESREEDQME